MRIGPEILKGVADSYRKLRNTARFLLGNLQDHQEKNNISFEEFPDLEKYILSRVFSVDKKIRDAYNSFSFQNVVQIYFQFCTQDLSSFYFDIRKDVLYCESPESIKRKATLTLLDLLFYRLTTWFAPIMPFTMEEVFLERFPNEESSIHLLDMPVSLKKWENIEEEEKWLQIRQVRKVVTGGIEVLRKEKAIGSSLEVFSRIFIKDEKLFNLIKSVDMSEICITSGVAIEFVSSNFPKDCFFIEEIADVGVICDVASGKKCQRCWTYQKSEFDAERSLCKRCSQVLDKDK
jgi:isoleucyl-tRNA synthetase